MNGILVSNILFLVILYVVASINGYPSELSKNHARRSSEASSKFEDVYRWKQISFTPLDNDSIIFGLTDKRLNDITVTEIMENYVAANNLPTGISKCADRIFVTIPRRRVGVPATVTYVRIGGLRGSSPSLHAYPDFRSNQIHPQNQADSKRIVSVYRTRICSCNRLWFVDTGVLDFPDNRIQVQQPSIWIFDLRTDTLMRRFEIPSNVVSDSKGIISLTVDASDKQCDDAYAYLPDINNYRLYVYSFRDNQMWSFAHNFMGYNPLKGDFDIAGQQYQWNDGIFSVALSEPNDEGFKTAYFHALASTSEFSVSTEILRNQSLAAQPRLIFKKFTHVGERNDLGQSAMHAYDETTRVMFFSQISLNAIGCWNTAVPLTESNFHILEQNNETMFYPSDVNVESDGFLWVITNRLPKFQYASLNPNEYNFRILKAPIRSLIDGTPCEYYLPPDLLELDSVSETTII